MTQQTLSEGREGRSSGGQLSSGRSSGRRPWGTGRLSRRRLQVLGAQVAVFVIVFGGWQLFTSLKLVDPFFWGQPSGIVKTLANWVQHGTSFGPIWQQISVTMEEAVLGFLIGTAAGIVVGVLLGQVPDRKSVV